MTGGGVRSEKQYSRPALDEPLRSIFQNLRMLTAMLRRFASGFQRICKEFSIAGDLFRTTFPPLEREGVAKSWMSF